MFHKKHVTHVPYAMYILSHALILYILGRGFLEAPNIIDSASSICTYFQLLTVLNISKFLTMPS